MSPAELPIQEIRAEFLSALTKPVPLIISAPTGSGKSTQVPQWMLDSKVTENGTVVVLQPRRIAARMLARRIAQERGMRLGEEVGYQIRHHAVFGAHTRLLFVTEGVLLRRVLGDPELKDISAIVFDEFHERHLHSDIMLALANQIRSARESLRIVVMSATLDMGALKNFLPDAICIESRGRTFPVKCEFLSKPTQQQEALWETITNELEKHHPRCTGHTLVFLPGAYEINRTLDALRASHISRACLLLPLHGELPPEQQDTALQPTESRKIILTTNVAETSLTVEDVDLVIDSGLARIASYDPHRGLDTLWVEKISRASADQRAGRAGRTRPGCCVRLWTRADHDARSANETPEILRVDLAETFLTLTALGHADWRKFPWFQPPEQTSASRAERLLRQLGAVDENNTLTDVGRRLLDFPAHPRLARLIIEGNQRGCPGQCLLAAAIFQSRPVLLRTKSREISDFRENVLGISTESDFFPLFRALEFARSKNFHPDACGRLGIHANSAREVLRIYDQLQAVASAAGMPVNAPAPGDHEPFVKSLLTAFPDRIARRLDAGTLRARTVENVIGVIDSDSHIRDCEIFLTCEIHEIGQSQSISHRRTGATGAVAQVRFSLNSAVKKEWLQEIFPHDFKTERLCQWDDTQRRLAAKKVTLFHGMVISEDGPAAPSEEESASALAARVLDGSLTLKLWDHRIKSLLARTAWCARQFPALGLPVWDESQKRLVLEQLFFGHHSYREIKDIDPLTAVQDWLGPHHLATVDAYAPTHVELASGRRARVTYRDDGVPVISARLQEFIGCEKTPLIGAGRVPALLELLAPNMRPVQVTTDLANFWKNTYPTLRAELSRRYPKHQWPEI
jgi:ATP-dependent helicase HrpB